MKTEDLPNGTSSVFEGAASEAEPAAAKARAAHTPPIDIIGGRRLTLYSGGTRERFRGCGRDRCILGLKPLVAEQELKPNLVSAVFGTAEAVP